MKEIVLRKISWIIGALSVIVHTGCVSVAVNHYQDGKAIGEDEFEGGIGVGSGRTVVLGISRVDSSGYVREESEGGFSLPVFSAYVRYGLSPTIDIGGELYSSLGSNGGRIYGKKILTNPSSEWGIAVMPAIGYARSVRVQSAGSSVDGEWESDILHGVFSLELPLIVSYHPSVRTAFTFGPRVYYYHLRSKDATTWFDLGVTEKNVASRSFVSSALAAGFKHRGFRSEITLVAVEDTFTDEVKWIPFIGVSVFGLEAIGNFIDAIF
jgi:hypothetical protein